MQTGVTCSLILWIKKIIQPSICPLSRDRLMDEHIVWKHIKFDPFTHGIRIRIAWRR